MSKSRRQPRASFFLDAAYRGSTLCVSIRDITRRIMANTKPDWRRSLRVAALAAVGSALLLAHGGGPSTASQRPAAPADSLEILEVRPSFFVIASAGANVGVQVGDDGVVVVDTGSA